ncbi:hypothetical protein BGZ73_004792 [Actinomortierella ambigua]|nr:hypothetical protein BGZ73_004792 [Actinomortierella ambigua]
MSLFSKRSSKKNKTASMVTTPLATPRASAQFDGIECTRFESNRALLHNHLSHAEVVDRLNKLSSVNHLQAMVYSRI